MVRSHPRPSKTYHLEYCSLKGRMHRVFGRANSVGVLLDAKWLQELRADVQLHSDVRDCEPSRVEDAKFGMQL